MKSGLKHLVECHCVLPQFRDRRDPPYHRFVVFSVIDDDVVVPKSVACNNCGVVHVVFDVSKSRIALGDDDTSAVMSIADITHSLPQNVVELLRAYNAGLPTWEEAAFIHETAAWGSHVLLTTKDDGTRVEGKMLVFVSQGAVKIEPYFMSHSLVT